jgi:hypothetical protein
VISPDSDSDSGNEDIFVSCEDNYNPLPPANMLNSRGNTAGTEKIDCIWKTIEKKEATKGKKYEATS